MDVRARLASWVRGSLIPYLARHSVDVMFTALAGGLALLINGWSQQSRNVNWIVIIGAWAALEAELHTYRRSIVLWWLEPILLAIGSTKLWQATEAKLSLLGGMMHKVNEVSFKLIGDMKIRDVTRPVTFDVTGKLAGDTIAGTATTKIMMKDFGFEPPSIAGVLTVQDGVTIKVNFTAKQV